MTRSSEWPQIALVTGLCNHTHYQELGLYSVVEPMFVAECLGLMDSIEKELIKIRSRAMTQGCNPSTQEAGAGGSPKA